MRLTLKAVQAKYLIALPLVLAGPALADAIHASPRYELSPEDRAAVEIAACMKPHGLKLDRALAYDFKEDTNATARCKSHGSVDRQPMHYRVSCVREDGGWRCWNTVEYLGARIGAKELYLVAPRERMSEAFGATKYLIQTGKFDLQSAGIADELSLKHRTIYHVHAEPAGERAVRIQKGLQWLYVERTPDGYRDVPESEAAVLGARIEEEAASRRPVYTYFSGHQTGDARYFRQAFLPTARIEGNRDGKFVSWTLDEYCALFNGTMANDERLRVRTIDISDMTGDSAIAKATLDHGGVVFTDYFVLLKVDGAWKIANKVYNARKK